MKKTILIFLIALLNAAVSFATDVDQVPNVHIQDRNRYVSDPDNMMSPEARARVDRELRALTDSTSAEVAVVLLSSAGDVEIEDFARDLADKWKIGKADKDNGVLLLLVADQRKARIHTGYGMEGILPDILCRKIIDESIIPAMKKGDVDAAIEGAVGQLAGYVENPEAAAEIASQQKEDQGGGLDPEALKYALSGIAVLVFLGCAVLFASDLAAARRRLTNYDKSLQWRKHLEYYCLLVVFSLGAALIFAIPAFLIYRRLRTKRVVCSTCGSKMHRLGEEEDNAFLTTGEDAEEKLDTVDYDVWLCDSCGTIEKFPYFKSQTKFTRCPRCGHITYGLVSDRIVRTPTASREGRGVKTYQCRHCGHRDDREYTIPRNELAGAVAAGGIAAGLSRGGGGGGFSGGSFGGGSFGGGGASGGW